MICHFSTLICSLRHFPFILIWDDSKIHRSYLKRNGKMSFYELIAQNINFSWMISIIANVVKKNIISAKLMKKYYCHNIYFLPSAKFFCLKITFLYIVTVACQNLSLKFDHVFRSCEAHLRASQKPSKFIFQWTF